MTCFHVFFVGKRIEFEDAGLIVSLTKNSVGEGSYSDVLKGYDVSNFKKYAIKKMLIQSIESEQNIKNEIDAFNRFKHTNILPCLAHRYIVDRKIDLKLVYLVFPFVSKGNLRQRLDAILSHRCKPFEIISLLQSFKGIAEALLVLHEFSPPYVHNDLKPEVSRHVL